MGVWQPLEGEAAGLPYRVTFEETGIDPTDLLYFTSDGPVVIAWLEVAGAGSVVWKHLHVRDPSPPVELLADLRREVCRDVEVIVERLSEAEADWSVPLSAGSLSAGSSMKLDTVTVLTFMILTERRVAFRTEWLTGSFGRVRQRFRFEPGSGFLIEARAFEEDLSQLSREIMDEMDLALPYTLKSGITSQFSRALSVRFRQDPAAQALALQDSRLEWRADLLEEALDFMQPERNELQSLVWRQREQAKDLLFSYVPELLSVPPAPKKRPDDRYEYLLRFFERFPPRSLRGFIEDDDVWVRPVALHPEVKARAPRKLTFPDRDSALAFVDSGQNLALRIEVPVLTVSGDGPSDREDLATYLRRFMWLLTEDEESSELMEWVARARSEETPGEVLLWLLQRCWRVPGPPDTVGSPPFQILFQDVVDLVGNVGAPPLRDGAAFHTYLCAQLEANEYRVVEAHVGGQALYRAVIPRSVLAKYRTFLADVLSGP